VSYLVLVTIGQFMDVAGLHDQYEYLFFMFYVVSYAGSVLRRALFVVTCLLSAERLGTYYYCCYCVLLVWIVLGYYDYIGDVEDNDEEKC
jgi:hypothetical protein